MAIFKTCKQCGDTFHGGDGFVRVNGDIYCCSVCAYDDGYEVEDTHWEELQPHLPEDQPQPHEQLLDDMAGFVDDLDTFFECLEDDDKLERARELIKRYHLLYRV